MNTAQQQFKNAISKHQNLRYTNVTFFCCFITTYITVKHVYKNHCHQKIAQTWCKKHC